MAEAVSFDELREALAAERRAQHESAAAHGELIRLVRLAVANGIPKTRVASEMGIHRETVRRYCQDS